MALQMPLTPGSIITLKCLGDDPGPTFLDGRTADGSVGLAPDTHAPPYSGTAWAVHPSNVADAVLLKCLGELEGPRYLSVDTGLRVNLQDEAHATAWINTVSGGGVVLHLPRLPEANAAAPARIYLNGETGTGTVNLAPSTSPPYTGTLWQVGGFTIGPDQESSSLRLVGAQDAWQSITAGYTGLMYGLGVMVTPDRDVPVAGSIRFYKGEGIGGQLLAEVPITFQPHQQLPRFAQFQECVVPTPFMIERGQVYTLRVASGEFLMFWLGMLSTYPRGQCSLGNPMAFRTLVARH